MGNAQLTMSFGSGWSCSRRVFVHQTGASMSASLLQCEEVEELSGRSQCGPPLLLSSASMSVEVASLRRRGERIGLCPRGLGDSSGEGFRPEVP